MTNVTTNQQRRSAARRAPWVLNGTLNINTLLAFAFGVIFISVMLGFAVFIPNPTPFRQWVFMIVVALAGGGIGAVIPGFFNLETPVVRAGGGLAVFAAILLLKPALLDVVVNLETPPQSPLPVIDAFLAKVDSRDLDGAWESLDDAAKQTNAKDRGLYKQAYENGRYSLGNVLSRTVIGSSVGKAPPGEPPAVLQFVNYKTKFESDRCYQEQVTVRATTALQWRVVGHAINPTPIPC